MLCQNQHPSDQVTSPFSPTDCSGVFQVTPFKATLLPPFLQWMVSATSLPLPQCCRTHSSCTDAIWGMCRLEGCSGIPLEHLPKRFLGQVVNSLSNQVFNISKDKDCTTWSRVWQLLILSWDFLFSSVCLLPFCSACWRRGLYLLYTFLLGSDSQQWASQIWISLLQFIHSKSSISI